MERVTLLFDASGELLGELLTSGGAFVTAILTAEGEATLGEHLWTWQTRGVPFGRTRVTLREPACLDAFTSWMHFCGHACATLSPVALECWQLAAKLKLRPAERRNLVLNLASLPSDAVASWRWKIEELVS